MSQHRPLSVSTRPLSGQQLMVALIKGKKIPSATWEKTLFRLKFLSRSVLYWPITHKLLASLASHQLLDDILGAQPNLPCKLHRPYLAVNMNKNACLSALKDHYNLILQLMPLKMRLGHLRRQPFVLSCVEAKNGALITLELAALDNLNKEGEITMLVRNANDIVLATITFALMYYQQQPTLFIGGLQGANYEVPHTEIKKTTKECYGIFPKRLVLEGICKLACHLGIRQIVAVGNATHIYQNWRYYSKKKYKLHADYDQFWLSMGGKLINNGYFLMPLHIPRKPVNAVISKKRAEYRRRYELLDKLEQGVAKHFSI